MALLTCLRYAFGTGLRERYYVLVLVSLGGLCVLAVLMGTGRSGRKLIAVDEGKDRRGMELPPSNMVKNSTSSVRAQHKSVDLATVLRFGVMEIFDTGEPEAMDKQTGAPVELPSNGQSSTNSVTRATQTSVGQSSKSSTKGVKDVSSTSFGQSSESVTKETQKTPTTQSSASATITVTYQIGSRLGSSSAVTANASSLQYSYATSLAPLNPTVSEKYVTLYEYVGDGRGLGNLLFNIAALVYVASLTGRTTAMKHEKLPRILDYAFDMTSIIRVKDVCPCFDFREKRALDYDSELERFDKPGHYLGFSHNSRSIQLHGFFQSWRYLEPNEAELRSMFQFNEGIKSFAQNYFREITPSGWKPEGFIRVAVHVRRGDNLVEHFVKHGYTVATVNYFRQAMSYFIEKHNSSKPIQFLVVSQDRQWVLDNIKVPYGAPISRPINVTLAPKRDQAQDLAVMAACDHVIMSTGTFGWWAGWLANGTTIYYSDWPRIGSDLFAQFSRENFFPAKWIGMTGA